MAEAGPETVVGRYAPSPTGALHFGSLVAAVASYCQARARGGRWLLRIDDLDTPRVVPGAADRIRTQLEDFGLYADGSVVYQSERRAAYLEAIARLKQDGKAFDCGCTRREAQTGRRGPEGPIYPGTCRRGMPAGRRPRSVRLCVTGAHERVADEIQGPVIQDLEQAIGDFVIQRADGIAAYQLATVLDDAFQGVTHVVRGADLLSSSPRQRFLQRCLGLAPTIYAHVPTVVDVDGTKLGKSTGALPIGKQNRRTLLMEALTLLGQPLPDHCEDMTVNTLLACAVMQWSTDLVPHRETIIRTGDRADR